MAFERFLHIKDRLRAEKNAPLRLLLLKEIFSIFEEISLIQDVRLNFSDPVALDPIFDLITFVRNVLLHFPLFDSWDQFFISPIIGSEMMPKKKSGQMASYLNNNLGKLDEPFEVKYPDGITTSSINLSEIKPNADLTYLKDIIIEDHDVTLIIDIVLPFYTASQGVG